jgi:microcompartment protein CcmK/EutM
MMAIVSDRLYQNVSASSSVTADYVVPNGKKLTIYKVGGDSPGGGEEECLFITHGSSNHDVMNQNLVYSGNGTKKVQIKLTNDQTEADDLGAYWEGKEQ